MNNKKPLSKKATLIKNLLTLLAIFVILVAICTYVLIVFPENTYVRQIKDTLFGAYERSTYSTPVYIDNKTTQTETKDANQSDNATSKDEKIPEIQEQQSSEPLIETTPESVVTTHENTDNSDIITTTSPKEALFSNLYKLLDSLKSGKEYKSYAEIIVALNSNQRLNHSLRMLLQNPENKILNNEQLLYQFSSIYKEIDLQDLKNQNTLWSDLKYITSKFIYVKNASIVNNLPNERKIIVSLNQVEQALKNNDLELAYSMFTKNNLQMTTKSQQWLTRLKYTLSSKQIILELEQLLTHSIK